MTMRNFFLSLLLVVIQLGCADAENDTQGRLIIATPEDGSNDVYLDEEIVIIFTDEVNEDALTSQSTNAACETDKTVQVSADDFTNCIGGTVTPHEGGGGRKFSFTPNEDWQAETTYKVKVGPSIGFKNAKSTGERQFSFETGTEKNPDSSS